MGSVNTGPPNKRRPDSESESDYSSLKNHESKSEYSGFEGKDSNPNLNIRYNTDNPSVVTVLCVFVYDMKT